MIHVNDAWFCTEVCIKKSEACPVLFPYVDSQKKYFKTYFVIVNMPVTTVCLNSG